MILDKIKCTLSRLIFFLWPTYIGLEKLWTMLYLPKPTEEIVEKPLRGFPLKLRYKPYTYLGSYLYYRGIYEEGVIKKLKQLLKPSMTFIDIGANIGLYSIIGSHLVGENGTIIAFEPQADQCDFIKKNIALNNFSNITVHQMALSDVNQDGLIYKISTTNDGQATIRIKEDEKTFGLPIDIKIRTLDSVLEETQIGPIDGIKIDVEGAELNVLKGLSQTLKNKPPTFILFEGINNHLERFNASSEELLSFLISHNYSIFCLQYGQWHRINNAEDHKKHSFSPDMLALLNQN